MLKYDILRLSYCLLITSYHSNTLSDKFLRSNHVGKMSRFWFQLILHARGARNNDSFATLKKVSECVINRLFITRTRSLNNFPGFTKTQNSLTDVFVWTKIMNIH